MKYVISKNINSIHYNPKTKVLEVTFHAGNATYHYNNVSEKEYQAFENAKSHGKHFDTYIKPKYHGRKQK